MIIDDDTEVAAYLANVARSCGYVAAVANDYDQFVRKVGTFEPTVILLDLQMPGMDGIEFLKVLGTQKCNARVVLVSGVDSRTLRTATHLGQLLGLQMSAPLSKPVAIQSLRRTLQQLTGTDGSVSVADLEAAIENNGIRPYFQPKVVRDKNGCWHIREVEALARWYRGDADILAPGKFIGIVEEAGLMPALTDSMLQQVCAELRKWADSGLELTAAVNLSPSTLVDRKLPDRLIDFTRSAGVANSQLILELTETVVLEYSAETLEVLNRLRVNGFGLSIDDFGTGYSSLEQLYRMPFSELKIDTSLIRACQGSEEARTIVETTVLLAKKLGLSVCAEGVENRETFDYLSDIDCDKQQGYFIGRPAEAAKFMRSIAHWHEDNPAPQGICCHGVPEAPLENAI